MVVVKGAAHSYRTRWPEWWLAALLQCQSWWLIHSQHLPVGVPYRMLMRAFSVNALTTFALTLSSAWLLALFANGTFLAFRRISPWVRATCGTLASLYWTMWGVMLYESGVLISTVTWINHAFFAIAAGICVIMSAREVAQADQKARQWKRIRSIGRR